MQSDLVLLDRDCMCNVKVDSCCSFCLSAFMRKLLMSRSTKWRAAEASASMLER